MTIPLSLPLALQEAVEAATVAATELGVPLYIAAGAVRDSILAIPPRDVDLVVEADPAPLVERLGAIFGGKLTRHDRFSTATIRSAAFTIDIARSRGETYARPGALPDVFPAPIADDLRRRDFTINAIALRLTPRQGETIDPFGGRADIESRLIRVLHDRSFEDDPTRTFRAFRYGTRLGFGVEVATMDQLQAALSGIANLSPARVRRELTLGLGETSHVDFFAALDANGVLAAADPGLSLPPARAAAWRKAEAGPHYGHPDLLGWCLLLTEPGAQALDRIERRLALTARVGRVLRDLVRLSERFAKLGPAAADSAFLDGLAPEAIWAMAVREEVPAAAAACRSYLEAAARVTAALSGDDLLAAGVPAGPEVGRLLRLLRKERLAGRVQGREEELALIEREIGDMTKGDPRGK